MRPRLPQALAIGLFILIGLVYTCLALKFPLGYIWATYEDLFGEWIQFWCFVVTSVLSARIAFCRCRYRLFFAVLCLSCIYVAMEEISWGQRLFGIASPKFFKSHNLQGELNLHNFLVGPYNTLLKGVLTYVLGAAMVIYGLAYPLALDAKLRLALWLDRLGVAAPPIFLAPYFVAAGILELEPFGFIDSEIAELLVAFALAFTALHFDFTLRGGLAIRKMTEWSKRDSKRLAARFGVTIVVVLNVATLTTLAIYATPSGRKRITRRIDIGVRAFAGRYGRHGNWKVATSLYERMHNQKPKDVWTMRKLAEAYRQLGAPDKADKTLEKALNIDLAKYEKYPNSASVNRNLVRTYRMMGDVENAGKYLGDVLQIGLERIQKHPTSANAAYSLGMTYELTGNNADALTQFERARELKPSSEKFRRGYHRMKNKQ